MLDQQRAGIDLLAVVFGQVRGQRDPDLIKGAAQPAIDAARCIATAVKGPLAWARDVA